MRDTIIIFIIRACYTPHTIMWQFARRIKQRDPITAITYKQTYLTLERQTWEKCIGRLTLGGSWLFFWPHWNDCQLTFCLVLPALGSGKEREIHLDFLYPVKDSKLVIWNFKNKITSIGTRYIMAQAVRLHLTICITLGDLDLPFFGICLGAFQLLSSILERSLHQ